MKDMQVFQHNSKSHDLNSLAFKHSAATQFKI